jgi:hypothetical protein
MRQLKDAEVSDAVKVGDKVEVVFEQATAGITIPKVSLRALSTASQSLDRGPAFGIDIATTESGDYHRRRFKNQGASSTRHQRLSAS